MLSGKILRDQLVLASKCLSGAFTADRVVSALLFSFVDKQEKLKKGQSRVNSSRHIVIDEETCQEIIMSLGNSRETRDVLRFFGVTLARQPRINYTMSCVPSCSMKSDSTLRENLRCVLPLLGADGTSSKRNWFLAVDESYWTPMWQLVSGLRGGDSRCILGGSFNYDSDYSEIPSTEQTPGDEFLSRMTLDFLVGSTVSWTICSVPVPQGAGQGKSKMQVAILDSILSLAAELGSLPMGIATDAGTVNTQTQDLLLCAAKPEEPSRFFSQCQANSLQYLPYCVWGYLTYKSHPVLGVLDCLHSLKRYSYHIHSSSRCVFWGRWFTSLSGMLQHGLNFKAYTIQDSMSDVGSFNRMNPKHLQPAPFTGGAYIAAFIGALVSGCTEGSRGLSTACRFANSVTAYGMLLLNLWAARWHFGKDWALHYLPVVTVRNLCQLLVQQMALCTVLPKDACVHPACPACMQEKICEYQYSQIKAPFRGSPCIRDAVMGTQLLHVKNLRGHTAPVPSEPEEALSKEEAKKLATRCWRSCFLFLSWICQGVPATEIEKKFHEWWLEEGEATLVQESLSLHSG